MTGVRPEAGRWLRLGRSGGDGRPHSARVGGVLAALTLPAILGLGFLHTELKESDPAEDAVLFESPSRVALTYTTDVQLALSTVEVRASAPDAAPVPAGKLAYLADDRRDVLVLPLGEPLGGGGHTVSWTTAGPDGHKLSGDYGFTVELPATAATDEPPGTAPAEADSATPSPGTAPEGDRSRSGARGGAGVIGAVPDFLFYMGIVGILGAVVFQWLILGQCARSGASREWIDSASSETATFAAPWLGLLLAMVIHRAWDRTATFFPDDVAGNLLTAVTGAEWAVGWWLLVGAVVVIGVALMFRKEDPVRPTRWKLVTLGALLLPVVPVLSGHGWSDTPRAVSTVATYLHVLAAGGWMGALGCLLWVHVRLVNEPGDGVDASPDTPGLAEMVAAFSRVAQVAVAVLLVTGALKIWTHVDAASQLWTTPWGRSLLVKAGVVAGVMALGLYNWRVVRPRLQRGAGGTRPAFIELLLGAAAVAVTSFLVTQPLN